VGSFARGSRCMRNSSRTQVLPKRPATGSLWRTGHASPFLKPRQTCRGPKTFLATGSSTPARFPHSFPKARSRPVNEEVRAT
jgi:hypothetical protein